MPRRPIPAVQRDGPFKVEGIMNQNTVVMGWDRWLFRRLVRTGKMEMSRLIHVNADFDFCMCCLSSSVFVNPEDGWSECYSCDTAFFILDEGQDP